MKDPNYIIAEFAGHKNASGYDIPRTHFGRGWKSTPVDYSASWDYFMLAYREAKNYLRNMERPSKNHCCKGDLLEVDIHCAVADIDMTKAYPALVKFVEWYNEFTQKKDI